MSLTRRQFALQAACAVSAAGFALRVQAQAVWQPRDFRLELHNTHTGESFAGDVCVGDGVYDQDCLLSFDRLLRDHRNGEVHMIDRDLFSQLLALPRLLAVPARYEVISGYRSPASNEALRSAGRGVVRNSMHLEGRAIDIRLLNVDCARLRDVALQASRGGVGYYQSSKFVHLDTGRVRAWAG